MEENPFDELKNLTPKNQNQKRSNPTETPSPGSDHVTSKDPSEEQNAKKTKIDSEGAVSREKRINRANKEFLEGNDLIFKVIKRQEDKMMDAHNLSNSKQDRTQSTTEPSAEPMDETAAEGDKC